MNWLNINVATLRSAEYIGSDPIARATWLNVSGWCCMQENGGRIANSRDWKDRQWQQICGVTADEVNASAPLLFWEGNDLVVWNYPVQKESEVAAKREGGRKGGLRSGASRREAMLEADLEAETKLNSNGKEWKGKERNEKGTTQIVAETATVESNSLNQSAHQTKRFPTLQEWLQTSESLHPDWPKNDATAAWEHYESLGWMKNKTPIRKWQLCIATCYRNWSNNPQRKMVAKDDFRGITLR